MDLKNPKTFNEKLQRLKLNDRRPEYTMLVDKYRVREYIENTLGSEYLIPLIGVWDDPDDIDFDILPKEFVLKCNHNSAKGLYICKDKSKLDMGAVKKNLREGLNQDYYYPGREWPYKGVKRKIICEKYISNNGHEQADESLTDYKFFCFDGYADCVMVCLGRNTGHTKFYFYDRDRNLLRYNYDGKNAKADFKLPKPDKLDEMFDIAEKLSKGIPFSRIDLYNPPGKIYFGEITFYPDSGFDKNITPEMDKKRGDMIDLKKAKSYKA